MTRETQRGIAYGVAAYAMWGLLPPYWKQLAHVPASEILAHRITWAFFALLAAIVLTGRTSAVLAALRRPKTLLLTALAALFVGNNWLLYVIGVNGGHLVEVSLGYFLNPLVNVLLGVILLGERLRRAQWAAVGLAAAGVIVLMVGGSQLPWLSLSLGVSFGLYGLVKKLAPLPSLDGQLIETAILTPFAIGWLLWAAWRGEGVFLQGEIAGDLWLVGAGPATALPLALFGASAQRIPLSWVGLLQYLAPSLQLLLGVALYREPFGALRATAFALVWAGLLLFVGDGLAQTARR